MNRSLKAVVPGNGAQYGREQLGVRGMSAKELLDRFVAFAKSAGPGAPLEWRAWQKEIVAEHEKAPDERDRVLCLDLHRALVNVVERQINPADLEELRKLRDQEYILLLIREAMIGQTDDTLDPFKMLAITTREVRAGRMREDDELHKSSVETVQKMREPSAPGWPTRKAALVAQVTCPALCFGC